MGGNQGPDDDSPSGIESVYNSDDSTETSTVSDSTERTEVRSSSGEAEEQQPTGEMIDDGPPDTQDGGVKSEVENERAFSLEDYTFLLSENQRLNHEVESLQSQLHKRQDEIEKLQKEGRGMAKVLH